MSENDIYFWGPQAIDWLNVSKDRKIGTGVSTSQSHIDLELTSEAGGMLLLYRLLARMKPDDTRLHLAIGQQPAPPDRPSRGAESSGNAQQAGDKLPKPLSALLNENGDESSPPDIPHSDSAYRHTWSRWSEVAKDPVVYGYRIDGETSITNRNKPCLTKAPFEASERNSNAGLLVLGDPAAGDARALPLEIPAEDLNWLTVDACSRHGVKDIILRTDAPQRDPESNSALYRYFCQDQNRPLRRMTTLVTNVRSLRRSEVSVGASLSWERIFDDVVGAADLFDQDFQRLIITVSFCGAVIIERSHDADPLKLPKHTLIFSRSQQENDWESQHRGRVLGNSVCLIAALVAGWSEGEVSWPAATVIGLDMMRKLHEVGYCHKPATSRTGFGFPIGDVRDVYYRHQAPHQGWATPKGHDLAIYEPNPESPKSPLWTILGEKLKEKSAAVSTDDDSTDETYQRAARIVREGATTLSDVPVESVNKWYSADRGEIEGFRSVWNAMRDYLSRNESTRESKPLSIAVFGPPGAGKSYVVRQLALKLGIDTKDHLTFNLSQYESAAELAKAFHKVRDVVLGGGTPLVFWDEFDSPLATPLGWLRYFLAPMQDGEFVEQGVVHPVGRGIYIFAASSFESFKEFAEAITDPTGKGATKHDRDKAADESAPKVDRDKAADGRPLPEPARITAAPPPKLRDFISRLKAYIDIKGPNQDNSLSQTIRRAFLLRSLLEKEATSLQRLDRSFDVHDKVLRMFLTSWKYKHGARSMENIVRLSPFLGKSKYEFSSLPPQDLLKMHVD